MKVARVTKLNEKYTQYDISTSSENFYVRTVSGQYVLIHNSPAIFAGIDPEDNKFFVGTKGVFSKTGKLVKSKADLDKYGYEGGLREKLIYALENLPKLGIGNVLQGDMMYTEDDLDTEDFDGVKHWVFQPNTITYAVPVDSELGKRIGASKMGIVFHTSYSGPTVADMQASFGAGVSGLNKTPDVWYDDAYYKDLTGVASLTDRENAKLASDIAKTRSAIASANFDAITGDMQPLFMQYVNARIRTDRPQIGDPAEFATDFVEWYKEYMQKQIAKLKNQDPESAAVKRRLEQIESARKLVSDNLKGIVGALLVYKDLIALKMQLIAKLNRIDSISTLVKTDTGYKVVNPEGFVAIGSEGGAVKLVDRLEFSKQNFTAQKNWSKT